MNQFVLEMKNITKEFPGVKALDNVNLQVGKGEIHALVGENGAGKSTLMKVLSGVHPIGTYTGDIYFDSNKCAFKDINDSEALGIVIIHQELALVPELSIAENVYLGNEQATKGIIDWAKTKKATEKLIEAVGMKASVNDLVKGVGVGQQQLVEIAKALSKDVKLLILDEPTAALNETESENLLKLLNTFRERGITSILISHKLKEVLKIADNVTILRDGQTIETLSLQQTLINEERIIKSMVGRDLKNLYPIRKPIIGEKVIEIKDWTVYHPQLPDKKIINGANLHLRAGEIVGIAGLMGAGRTELVMSIFGKSYGKRITGKISKNGKEITVNNVGDAIHHGFAYVSEDRKEYGLILQDSVKKNITLANLRGISNKLVVNPYEEVEVAQRYKEQLNIKMPSIDQQVVNLSGGNQQKVVLGKWMFTEPEILILDEPTRGIDVGAKNEIYKIINDLATHGKSILMVSSELPELLGICDRIYTLSDGLITGEFLKEDANQETLMASMTDNRRAHI